MATKPKVEKTKSNSTTENNRIRRLLRVAKQQPNNKQVEEALKTTRMPRKAPTNRVWSHSWRKTAQVIKAFSGFFDKDIMSTNPVLASAALSKRKESDTSTKKDSGRVDFSLGARAKDKYGINVWK